MKRIGIISDTHSTFDDTLRDFLRDVDEIWHAGDIGSLETADLIASFKPLRAVTGNIDGGLLRRTFTDVLAFDCEGVRVLMTHIGGYPLRSEPRAPAPRMSGGGPPPPRAPPPRRYDPRALARIRQVEPKLFVCGHSHILRVMYDPVYSLLAVNPGAAGNYGVHKVRTAIRLVIDKGEMRDMEVGEWPRSSL